MDMDKSEIQISGNIFAKPDRFEPEGEHYVIRSKFGQGWGLPVRNITPDDLRALADHIEKRRLNNGEMG